MVRQLGWTALGIVVGFLAGGLLPRLENTDLQDQLTDLSAQLAETGRSPSGGRSGSALPVPGMSDMFNSEPRSKRPRRDRSGEGVEGVTERRVEDGTAQGADTGSGDMNLDPEDIQGQFDLAVDAQDLRADQSRSALQEQADLTDEEMEVFDTVVADMNNALAEYGEELMELALSGEEPEAEEMLGLTHEVTGILYDTQSNINDLVGMDGMADTDPSARQAWNHVDLEVFRGVVEEMEP